MNTRLRTICSEINNSVSESELQELRVKVKKFFRVISGKSYDKCAYSEAVGMFFVENELLGTDEELTNSVLIDCLALALYTKDTEAVFCTETGASIAKGGGFVNSKQGTFDEALLCFETELGLVSEKEDIIDEEPEEDAIDEDDDDEWDSPYNDEEFAETENIDDGYNYEELPPVTPAVVEEPAKEEVKENEQVKEDKEGYEKRSVSDRKIVEYYAGDYRGMISELAKRYTSLFESGYELIPLSGILTMEGMARLSGSTVKYKVNSAIRSIYDLFIRRLGFVECPDRSNTKIVNRIYSSYLNGGTKRLYFPYKMLEFAYGRKAPDGDDQNSLNTYKEHSESKDWKNYCKKEIFGNLERILEAAAVTFIKTSFDEKDYFTIESGNELKNFIRYFGNCLSNCIAMVEWKTVKDDIGIENVFSFKVRFSDNEGLIDSGIINEVMSVAFVDKGKDPLSMNMLVDEETGVKEIGHEFEHTKSQGMPLFAYKAYLALKAQGIEPTVENMILGRAEDGTILKNGRRGVNLSHYLIHNILAGTRAGKGVMTLNFLASSIYSNKAIFYLDDKPDMATIFQHMCPDMFVVNGSRYSKKFDDFGFYGQIDSMLNMYNIPQYVGESFGILDNTISWYNSYGALFYTRALLLALGIVAGRGMGQSENPEFGGEDGVAVIVDEYSMYMADFRALYEGALGKVPPAIFDEDVLDYESETKPAKKASKLNSFKLAYNNTSLYAISWLNSIVESALFMEQLRRESFSDEEVSRSDIYVIGQDSNLAAADAFSIRSALQPNKAGARYKMSGVVGIPTSSRHMFNLTTTTLIKTLLGFRGSDAMYGRSDNDYLLASDNRSKAHGKLDDKANNFAYILNYTDDTRKTINKGANASAANLDIASKAIYFKPFLVINANNETYVKQLLERCSKSGVSVDEVISDNKEVENEPLLDKEGGTGLTNMVGFRGYMQAMGIPNLEERLRKSGDIANRVVKLMGYPGTWFEFITDLRPEWLFTTRDVANAMNGISIKLTTPKENPILNEWNKYMDFMGDENSGDMEAELLQEDGEFSEFSNEKQQYEEHLGSILSEEQEKLAKEVRKALNEKDGEYHIGNTPSDGRTIPDIGKPSTIDIGDNSYFSYDTEFDLDNDDLEELMGSGTAPDEEYQKGNDRNTYNDEIYSDDVNERINRFERDVRSGSGLSQEECDYLINLLRDNGVDVSSAERTRNVRQREEEYYTHPNKDYTRTNRTVFRDTFNFSEGEYSNSLEKVVQLITKDVISKFGGLQNITSFREKGGSLIINGTCYSCNISKRTAMCLPYDLRAEIGSGCVARLFNYSMLKDMRRLRLLEFESYDFVYDTVAHDMGYGNRVSVDLFFGDLPIQTLIIGDRVFEKRTYRDSLQHEYSDYYNPRFYTRMADFSEKYVDAMFQGSWQITRNAFTSKNRGFIRRASGVVGGSVLTATTGATKAALKATRGIARGAKKVGVMMNQMRREYDRRKNL